MRGRSRLIALAAAALAASASGASADSSKVSAECVFKAGTVVTNERTCIYVARGLTNPPSKVRHVIAWGDGKSTTVTLDPTEERRIPHRYGGRGTFTVVDTVTYLISGQTYTVKFTLKIVGSPAAPTPKVPKPKLYDVRITTDLKHVCNPGCDADQYGGTQKRTLTVKGLRVTFKNLGFSVAGLIEVAGTKAGTETTAWDHGHLDCREKPVVTRPASAGLFTRYGLPGTKYPTETLRINSGPAGPPEGDPVLCSSNMQIVPLAARANGSLVGGQLTDSYVSLTVRVAGASGKPGFPLDRLIAGKGFTLSLKGQSVDKKNFTTGSLRIVFTPRRRALSAARRSTTAAATTCAKTHPDWWSKSRRACFVVTANASWQEETSWTRDRNGVSCTGSDFTKMRWSTAPSTFWIGTTGLIGYSGESRRRTSDLLGGPVKATVTRRASGGSWEFGCVRLLTKDCGTKKMSFADLKPAYMVADSNHRSQLVLTPVATAESRSPFRSCGLVEGDTAIAASPDFGGYVMAAEKWRPGIGGALDDIVTKRLLAVPIGGKIVFRGTGQPADADGPGGLNFAGKWIGTLTFKRVR
jgi:hypothetical protein